METGDTSNIHWALTALIGAAAAIVAGVPLEHYRRHRDRQGTAAVISSEIAAMLHIVKQQDTVAKFKTMLPILDAGTDIPLPKMFAPPAEFGPIFENYIDKIGLLPVGIADRCVEFYSYIVGIRGLIKNLIDTSWAGIPTQQIAAIKASWIRAGEKLWSDAESIANPLIEELRNIANEPWIFAVFRLLTARFFSLSRAAE